MIKTEFGATKIQGSTAIIFADLACIVKAARKALSEDDIRMAVDSGLKIEDDKIEEYSENGNEMPEKEEGIHKMMDEFLDKVAREIAKEIISDGREEP